MLVNSLLQSICWEVNGSSANEDTLHSQRNFKVQLMFDIILPSAKQTHSTTQTPFFLRLLSTVLGLPRISDLMPLN